MDSTDMDDIPDLPPMHEILVEFRAGKMIMEGKRVIPDTRKGVFRLARGEEGLVHFQWYDRSTNIIEDDQIVFSEEAVFEKVNQAAGRVYILKFLADDRKFFFWMQESEAENDSDLCDAVNLCLKHPSEFADEEEQPEAPLPPQYSVKSFDEDIPSRAGNLVLPSMGGEASSGVTSSGPIKLADLQRILSNIGSSADDAVDPDAGLGLGDILRPDLISPLIMELPVGQQLSSYLPEGQWNTEELIELLQSPPFRQQVDSFTYVLRTGQIDLTQFGIDPSKFKLTVPSFLEALEDSVMGTTGSAETSQDDNDLKSQACNRRDAMDES